MAQTPRRGQQEASKYSKIGVRKTPYVEEGGATYARASTSTPRARVGARGTYARPLREIHGLEGAAALVHWQGMVFHQTASALTGSIGSTPNP